MFPGRNYILTDEEFQLFQKLVFDKFGIFLSEQKKTLLITRLEKKLKELNLNSFREYYYLISREKDFSALSSFIDTVTTNYTYFYRENEHFDYYVKEALPNILKETAASQSKDLRVWSAGCSSGEEPYTIQMLQLEFFGNNYNNWKAGILATDVSDKVLRIAKNAEYSTDSLRFLPKPMLLKYFVKVDKNSYRVKEELSRDVVFRRFNLMADKFPFKKKFQAIFCRNVLIYFNEVSKKKVLNNFYENLEENGYLFIGHSESIVQIDKRFKYIQPSIYRKQ